MKLVGFAPDVDATLEGVITDCEAVVPSIRGMESAPTPTNTILAALSAQCQGAASLLILDGSSRVFAGESIKLKLAGGADWTDVSKTSVGAYSTVTGRWRFAEFGNVSLATSKENTLQAFSSSLFADVSGAPKADIVEVVNQFAMLFNTNDGTYGDSLDRWWCCALGDYTNWTPSIATQAATGRLTSVPGKITAGKRFGDNIVVFKQQGLYLGIYTGPPFIWSFPDIPTAGNGTHCQESVISIGTPEQPKLFYVGTDNFYVFDGARPIPVGFDIKNYFFARLNMAQAQLICLLHDRPKSRVYVFYPSGSSTSLNDCVVYNYRTGRWGRDPRSIEFAFEYVASGLSYNDLGTYYSTYSDLPSAAYDQAFISSNTQVPAVFSTAHRLQLLNGTSSDGYFVLGDIGNDLDELFVDRVKPQWMTKPTTATLTNYYRQSLGDSLTQDSTATMSESRFDFMRSARWHRFKINTSGNFELNKVGVSVQGDGSE